ncbi:hypothetical protein BG006_003220 [Podila minutissima]|uniref:Antifreeze protein n=1 Tax=Podila minutissima TaxID=64525 RepID=A0A9P5SRL1_9FUNG|nr:hypothetical protein BG006_003220 [Podila minutissima]
MKTTLLFALFALFALLFLSTADSAPLPAPNSLYAHTWCNAFYSNCYQASIINCGSSTLMTRNCGVTFSATGACQSIEALSRNCAHGGGGLLRSIATSAYQMTLACSVRS